MDTLKEDAEEEREYRSLTSYDQQRYTRRLQEIRRYILEAQIQLKEKWDKNEILDEIVLSNKKELLENHISHFRHQISLWKDRNSDKTKL